MSQETQTAGPFPRAPIVSLTALLALAGARRLHVTDLQERMKLTPEGCDELLTWLQHEYLVDVVSTLEGNEVNETVELTDKGERLLIALLEHTCELPELH